LHPAKLCTQKLDDMLVNYFHLFFNFLVLQQPGLHGKALVVKRYTKDPAAKATSANQIKWLSSDQS